MGLPRSRKKLSRKLTVDAAAHARQSAAAARAGARAGLALSARWHSACLPNQGVPRARRPRDQHASAERNKGDSWACRASAPTGPLLSSQHSRAGNPCPLRAGSPRPLRAGGPRPLRAGRTSPARAPLRCLLPAARLSPDGGCLHTPTCQQQAAALRSVRAQAATPTMWKSLRHARSPTQCPLCCQAFRFARPSPAVGHRAPPAPGWQPLIRSISCRAGCSRPPARGSAPPRCPLLPGAADLAPQCTPLDPASSRAAPRTRARDRAARPALAASGRLLNTSLLAAVWPRGPDASWLAAHAALARSAGANTW